MMDEKLQSCLHMRVAIVQTASLPKGSWGAIYHGKARISIVLPESLIAYFRNPWPSAS